MNFTINEKDLIIYGVLFVVAIVLGIIVGVNTDNACWGIYTSLAILTTGLCPVIRKFMMWTGKNIVNFSVTLDLVIVLGILFYGAYYVKEIFEINYLWFVLLAFLTLVSSWVKNYLIYLFLDIHTMMKNQNRTIVTEQKLVSVPEEAKETSLAEPSKDTKNCPHCNAEIKATAKKCRFCGEWLTNNKEGNN